ncbi:MAG: hypothetical protein GWN30_06080, partial [Gammaproteobacteria bacterium]|nr:hypothetical protein [Gammaproteobacteria bacterium]
MNGGDNPWGPPGIVAGLPIDILVDPLVTDTLFVNNYGGGNIKSTDGGNTFSLASQGYTGAQLFNVEAFPDNPSRIIVAGRSGVFQGFNHGASWRGLSYPPANFLETSAVSIKPDESNVLIAGAGGDDWMYRSIDNGNSWEKVFTIPNGESNCFRSFAFANSNPEIVYAGTCTSFHTTIALDFGLDGLGIYKSEDGGNNWQEANDANVG